MLAARRKRFGVAAAVGGVGGNFHPPQIEFLAFPNLSENERRIFQEFSDVVEVVGLGRTERGLIDRIVSLHAQYRLKLPDAIIAGTAVERGATLITDDRQLRKLSAIRSSGTSASE